MLLPVLLKGDPSTSASGAPPVFHLVPQLRGLRPGRLVLPQPPGRARDRGGERDPTDSGERGATPPGEGDDWTGPDGTQVTTNKQAPAAAREAKELFITT